MNEFRIIKAKKHTVHSLRSLNYPDELVPVVSVA